MGTCMWDKCLPTLWAQFNPCWGLCIPLSLQSRINSHQSLMWSLLLRHRKQSGLVFRDGIYWHPWEISKLGHESGGLAAYSTLHNESYPGKIQASLKAVRNLLEVEISLSINLSGTERHIIPHVSLMKRLQRFFLISNTLSPESYGQAPQWQLQPAPSFPQPVRTRLSDQQDLAVFPSIASFYKTDMLVLPSILLSCYFGHTFMVGL